MCKEKPAWCTTYSWYISSTSTCFGRIKVHHEEVQPYVYNHWYLLFFLDDYVLSWLDSIPTRTTDSLLKRIISTNCCIHTVYLLMMGLDTPETCRGWRNILRISCASSWFFFTHRYFFVFISRRQERRKLDGCIAFTLWGTALTYYYRPSGLRAWLETSGFLSMGPDKKLLSPDICEIDDSCVCLPDYRRCWHWLHKWCSRGLAAVWVETRRVSVARRLVERVQITAQSHRPTHHLRTSGHIPQHNLHMGGFPVLPVQQTKSINFKQQELIPVRF